MAWLKGQADQGLPYTHNMALAPSSPISAQLRSMLVTDVLTFSASAMACRNNMKAGHCLAFGLCYKVNPEEGNLIMKGRKHEKTTHLQPLTTQCERQKQHYKLLVQFCCVVLSKGGIFRLGSLIAKSVVSQVDVGDGLVGLQSFGEGLKPSFVKARANHEGGSMAFTPSSVIPADLKSMLATDLLIFRASAMAWLNLEPDCSLGHRKTGDCRCFVGILLLEFSEDYHLHAKH